MFEETWICIKKQLRNLKRIYRKRLYIEERKHFILRILVSTIKPSPSALYVLRNLSVASFRKRRVPCELVNSVKRRITGPACNRTAAHAEIGASNWDRAGRSRANFSHEIVSQHRRFARLENFHGTWLNFLRLLPTMLSDLKIYQNERPLERHLMRSRWIKLMMRAFSETMER